MPNKIQLHLMVVLSLLCEYVVASNDDRCYRELTEIVASSNSLEIINKGRRTVALVIDRDEDHVITARLRLVTNQTVAKNESEWEGEQGVGWVKYYENEGVLHQMPPNEDELPIILTTDKKLIEKFNKCRNNKSAELGSIFMRVSSKGRSYFYREPNQHDKIKDLFLIKGDMVKVLDEAGEFRFVQYKQKNGNVVEGWFLSKDLTIITH